MNGSREFQASVSIQEKTEKPITAGWYLLSRIPIISILATVFYFSERIGMLIPVLAIFGYITLEVYLRTRRSTTLRLVEVDENGVTGTTFSNRRIRISWDELSEAVLAFSDSETEGWKPQIHLRARGKKMKIDDRFETLDEIGNVVLAVCLKRRIKFTVSPRWRVSKIFERIDRKKKKP